MPGPRLEGIAETDQQIQTDCSRDGQGYVAKPMYGVSESGTPERVEKCRGEEKDRACSEEHFHKQLFLKKATTTENTEGPEGFRITIK